MSYTVSIPPEFTCHGCNQKMSGFGLQTYVTPDNLIYCEPCGKKRFG